MNFSDNPQLRKALSQGPLLLIWVLSLSACAVKKLAVNSMANSISESGTSVYAQDDDPDFVGAALPFGLKTMEALLQATPRHEKLLVATASGFVQYAHAYVLRPSQDLELEDLTLAKKERLRAKRFFLRARGYGLRALELRYPGISKQLLREPLAAARRVTKRSVPALYWTGAAWASAISAAKDDMALVGDLPIVTALLERALALEEGWNKGAIHEFFIVFNAGRTVAERGGVEKAEAHFQRAMALNMGLSISPLVSMAESVCVRQQDRQRFKELLAEALAFDVNQHPENRLANIFAQQKAAELLRRVDDLFFLDEPEIQHEHDASIQPYSPHQNLNGERHEESLRLL